MTNKLLVLLFWNVVVFGLQLSLSPWISVWGVIPDLSLIAVFLSGWLLGPVGGAFSGLVQGWLFDWFNGYFWGMHLFWYGLCGMLSGLLQRPVLEENRFPTFLYTCMFTALTQLGILGLLTVTAFPDLSWRDALRQLAVLVPYNGLLAAFLYPRTSRIWRWWRRGLPRG